VLTAWRQRPLASLLAEHGLDGLPEWPFPTDGWSGARFSLIERGRERFVIKRTSPTTDWIAAATRDTDVREACLAASWLLGRVGPWPIPYLGAAADGDDAAILMPDLSSELIAWERPSHEAPMSIQELDRVLGGVARLPTESWASSDDFPWCPLRERLLLTSRVMCETQHRASGIPAGLASAERLLAGWDAFDRLASVEARRLVADLSADIAPLIEALRRLPSLGLHGDLKFANVALGPEEDDIGFIDWSMTIRAPVAVELGWLLVSNSASLPETPPEVLERYRSRLGSHDRTMGILGDWEAQVDLAWIIGLLLRGWRKGLDAEAGNALGSGVSGADDLAWWCASAVEAARRRL
jgi:hypothetical protein